MHVHVKTQILDKGEQTYFYLFLLKKNFFFANILLKTLLNLRVKGSPQRTKNQAFNNKNQRGSKVE